jgi:replicative DNA helicase
MSARDDLPQLRIPPQSMEAESALLGLLMLDNEAVQRVANLPPEAFYAVRHQQVFRAIKGLATAGKSFDVVTVRDAAQALGCEMSLGEINEMAQMVPTGAKAGRYAEIVAEKWQLRRLITTGDEIAASGFNGESPAAVIDKAQMALAKLAETRKRREPQHITESLANYLGLLQDLSEGKNPAMPTGLRGLDRLLNGGLRRGGMMVIGARPKHGKTALALAMARNIARQYSVLYISQEMPINELMHRHTAAAGSFDLGRILSADASDHDMWTAVTKAAERLGELHLTHDEQCAQSLMDVRRKAMQVKRVRGLDVIFVDFLQLMQGASEETRNRELDVIANGIKQLAMDLDCAAVLLSQMTREADKSYSRPVMTYLRDSGAIEAAADQIALLHTDHAHPLSKKYPQFAEFSELEIVAHRNGPKGLVPLRFIGRFQQYGDWEGELPRLPETKHGGGL